MSTSSRLISSSLTPAINNDVRHGIPRIMNADEQEEQDGRPEREKSLYRVGAEDKGGSRNDAVGRCRQHDVKHPVLEHGLVIRLLLGATSCQEGIDDAGRTNDRQKKYQE